MTQILLGADTHHRRCHYAYARAHGGAYGASNESASNPASDKADCGFRRNRATHEREGQSYHRNNFHQASSSFGMARYSLRLAMMIETTSVDAFINNSPKGNISRNF